MASLVLAAAAGAAEQPTAPSCWKAIKPPPVSVIQGGVGAGLLYLCYTTDLPDAVHNHPVDKSEAYCKDDGAMVNFFDDGTNFVADEDPEVVTKAIHQNYRRIED